MNAKNSNVKIRLAVPNDARAISSILTEAFAEYESLYTKKAFAATTPTREVIKSRFNEGWMWVAVLEEKIVGTVSAVSQNKDLYIRSMAILPVARGNKIGEQLLETIENFAARNDFQRITLSTTPFLNRAIRLYEKFGFVRIGFDNLYGTPLITMAKNNSTN